MKRVLGVFIFLSCFFIVALAMVAYAHYVQRMSDEEFEVLGEDENNFPVTSELKYERWERPLGPLRVGLQVGHWKNQELPDELKRLRERGGGARGAGRAEWEVNLAIAQAAAKILQEKGIVVDILPATIPPDYWADAFVAIHADGSTSPNVSGFKVAAPRRDVTGKGSYLVSLMEEKYSVATGLKIDPNITRNMRGYYAFNWRRYKHSIHPMTPAIILEAGFLTSPSDQKILIHNPSLSAQGIVDALSAFLKVNE